MHLPNHGANPHSVYESLNITPPATLLDFSENCNPNGPPKDVYRNWSQLYPSIARYPDPNGEPFLTAVAAYHGVPSSQILLGNGAAELLALFAQQYSGKKAILVHPTFSEYEATLTATGAEIIHLQAREEDDFALPLHDIKEAMTTADILYLCTPNNPTGVLPSQETIHELLETSKTVSCDILLDEAFIDWVDESRSFIKEITNYPNLIVVRSMTKLYAIPGIRLGYAVAHPHRIAHVKRHVPHWNVNALAARIGAICLEQEEYRKLAIQRATEERRNMTSFLVAHGCRVIHSVTNYLLFQPPTNRPANSLFKALLSHGIVVRHTENFRGLDGRWLRIGMKTAKDMSKLRTALEACFTTPRGTLTFISGGVRSGKSSYAEQVVKKGAQRTDGRLVYIASGKASDDEMKERIERHKIDRADDGWTTFEQPTNLEEVLPHLQPGDHVLWDCVTTWLANEAFTGWESGTPCILQPECIDEKIRNVISAVEQIQATTAHFVIVSNEVFDEQLKDQELTRTYTLVMGALHQQLVAKADCAIEMDSGIPIIHKEMEK